MPDGNPIDPNQPKLITSVLGLIKQLVSAITRAFSSIVNSPTMPPAGKLYLFLVILGLIFSLLNHLVTITPDYAHSIFDGFIFTVLAISLPPTFNSCSEWEAKKRLQSSIEEVSEIRKKSSSNNSNENKI